MSDAPPADLELPPTLSAAAMKWLLGLSNSRLEQLTTAGIVTRVERGQYSIGSIRRYAEEQRRMRAFGPAEFNRARTALATERAAAARMTRLQREGELLPRDLVGLIITATFTAIRDRCLGLGTRVAAQCHVAPSVPAIQKIIDEFQREALEAVSQTSESEVMQRIEQAAEAKRDRSRAS
jgi:hypothetical protein